MNTEKKIEQCLRAAPKPPAPDGLLDKLQTDVSTQDIKTHRSSLRRWFAPTGRSISPWRVAAAAAIAIAVLLPLSYGATKLIKHFITISQLGAIKKVGFPCGGAALSPDGKHFAGTTTDFELVVIDISTGEQRKLAKNCFWATPVVWSADGSEIAFVSRSGDKDTHIGRQASSLLALSLKTGKTRILMEDLLWLEDWSSDGKLILGERRSKEGVVSAVMVNLENKEETVLAKEWASPRFSPNAGCLSYVTKEANRSILHLRKVDGTSHVKYTDFPGDISRPLWSPDGTYVVFTGTQMGIDRQHKDLWALRVQGNQFVGAPLPVVPDVEQMQFFNWSQNGQLAYRTGFELGGIFTLPVDLQTGKATGPPRQLMRGGNQHCWSPDGKQIALWQKGGLIFISAGSGEKIRNLSVAEIRDTKRGMSWSPDGRLIACAGIDKEKRWGVFLITVETGHVKLLVPLEEEANSLTWSPDGKTIAYGYKRGVYVVNIEDGKPRRIASPTEKEDIFNRPVFAPDGGSVAYAYIAEKCDTVLATTVDGKETREICHLKNTGGHLSIKVFYWSPDGRHIVFTPTPASEKIWCAPTDGGEPFLMADISNLGETLYAWWPEWSPKGDAISFGVFREEYQYWVMENFLPAAEAGGR